MPPLGIGGMVPISDGSTIPSQDALNSLSHEIQRLQATKSDLQENMKTLHKYILAVFCLYCRHLCIQHKQKKRSFSTSTQHFLTKTQQKIQEVTQFASQYYAKHIVHQLQHLKFIHLYFSLNATQIQHNSNAAFLRKIVAVYCVFDRVVHTLDGKIEEKRDAVSAHILRLQQQYEIQSKSVHVTVAGNADNAETEPASVRSINTNLKALKTEIEVDGDSDSELQKNVMTDAEVRTLQRLIDVSRQKNPSAQVAALEQLAALLPPQMNVSTAGHSVQAQAQSVVDNHRFLIIQPTPQIITTAAAPPAVLVGGLGGGCLLATPLIILPQNTGNYGQKTSGYKRGGGGGGSRGCATGKYYQKQSGGNYNGGTTSGGYGNCNGGGYGGYGGDHGHGANNGGGPINHPFGPHSQHIYEQHNRNNNRQRQQQNYQQQPNNYNQQQQQQGNSMNSMNNMNNYGHVQDVPSGGFFPVNNNMQTCGSAQNGYIRRPPPTIPPPPIPIPMAMPMHNLQTSNNYFIPPIPPIPAIPTLQKNTYQENLPSHNYQFQIDHYNHNHNQNHNTSANDIKKEQVEDHKVGGAAAPSAKSKRFPCTICNVFWFETGAALRMHVNTHLIMERATKRDSKDPKRPWQCEVCSRKFAEKCTLQRHVRIHTKEKPWKCKFCSKAFNQSCSLQAHVRIHTGERPFPCSLCEKSFRQSTHRRQHMKTVHKQQWESAQLQKAKKKAKKRST